MAVLAALNLADEVFRHRAERDGRKIAIATRAGELERCSMRSWPASPGCVRRKVAGLTVANSGPEGPPY